MHQGGSGKEPLSTKESNLTLSSTFFVSNLPYSATSTDLQTLFSDYAPVRSAFVVIASGKDGQKVSKGVGYVSFAIKEDAVSTMETVRKDGVRLNNRELRVEWARRKHKVSAYFGSQLGTP